MKFGNCDNSTSWSNVQVKVNDRKVATANVNENKEIRFAFQKGTRLEILENDGIIRLDEFIYDCTECKVFKCLAKVKLFSNPAPTQIFNLFPANI